MSPNTNRRFIPVRGSQIQYYRKVALYYDRGENKGFNLYKPAGTSLADMRITQHLHPELYIRQSDRLEAIKEIQKGFNDDIAAGKYNRDIFEKFCYSLL